SLVILPTLLPTAIYQTSDIVVNFLSHAMREY
ncbi:hypothetical protein QZH41_001790, partial [Actinostola sp. cb2023]